jgi:hypothetical protein
MGGGHDFFDGIDREDDGTIRTIPTIANGFDVKAIGDVSIKDLLRRIDEGATPAEAMLRPDLEEQQRLYADLPSEPDEKLR